MKFFNKLTVILGAACILFSQSLAAQPAECADNGHFFDLVPGGVTWAAAETAAAGMTRNGVSGYLATITSAPENTCVAAAAGSTSAWLGGNDIAVEDTWVWITGEAWGYTNWNTGEPNDSGGEDCLHMVGGASALWNDLPCGNTDQGGYVVEFEPGVEVSVTGADNLGVAPVIAGSGVDNIDFTFTAENDAAYDDATGVIVSAVLQFSVDRNDISCTLLPAGYVVTTDTATELAVAWPAIDLAAAATADFDVTCTAGATATDGNMLTATVSMDAVDQADDDDTNDSDVLSVTIEREFDLALTVVDSPDPVLAGSGVGNLTYTFSLSRVSGPSVAPGVTVDVAYALPTGVSVLDWTETTGTFDGATWTVGDVAADGPVGTLTINLTVDSTAVDCVDCVSATGTVNTTSGTDTVPGNNTDIADPTSVETAASASSGFDTSIVFTNGDDGMVDVTLVCNGGLPLEQTTQISAASGVNFSVTNLDFIAPNTSCTISLSGLDTGYTAAVMANGEDTGEACVFSGTPVATESAAFATDRANTCVITATPEPTMVMVDTDVVGVEDPIIDTSFVTTISCDNVSLDTGPTFGTEIADDTTGAFTADWYAEPGETSDCTVSMVPNSSVVEGDSCTFSFVLGDAEAGCDVTGTVFFEGIPTLSQYGMAILALLMLSVGFVGFRRFI